MNRTRSLVIAVFVAILLIPTFALADAAVVQDSCVYFQENGQDFVRIHFTIVNFSLPTDVCDLHLIPEPQPPDPGCVMLSVGAPAGWSAFLDPLGGADWYANTPGDCIDPGTAKGNFWFVLDPSFCCYIAQFTGPTGAVILEQEECFTNCKPVDAEAHSWGEIKNKYR
jgi:hypothetical protein